MDKSKIKEIANYLTGLKYYEWSQLKTAVEKCYSSKIAKLELNDYEELADYVNLEMC